MHTSVLAIVRDHAACCYSAFKVPPITMQVPQSSLLLFIPAQQRCPLEAFPICTCEDIPDPAFHIHRFFLAEPDHDIGTADAQLENGIYIALLTAQDKSLLLKYSLFASLLLYLVQIHPCCSYLRDFRHVLPICGAILQPSKKQAERRTGKGFQSVWQLPATLTAMPATTYVAVKKSMINTATPTIHAMSFPPFDVICFLSLFPVCYDPRSCGICTLTSPWTVPCLLLLPPGESGCWRTYPPGIFCRPIHRPAGTPH